MTKEEVIDAFNNTLQLEDLYKREETFEQYEDRMRRFNKAIDAAISMLQNATVWTPCSERMPTMEDGDEYGDVNVMNERGFAGCQRWYNVRNYPDIIAWSRIEPKGGGNG